MLDELLVGLGFEYDPAEAKQFKDDIEKTTKFITSLTKVAVGAATAITGMTIASTKASDEQGKLSNEIGVSVDAIDALQFALTRAGGSSEGMVSSLRNLTVRAAEAARGIGSGVEVFGLLGISATDANGEVKKSSDLLLEISNRFQGLSKAKQVELADKLGLGDSIRLLQEGPKAIQAYIDQAEAIGTTTAEDAKIAADFQDSLTDLWKVVKSGSRVLTREFAPILSELINNFTSWWKENRKLIEQNLPEWIDKAGKALKILLAVSAAFVAGRLLQHLFSAVALFKSLSVAAMAANVTALLLPALIGAAVAGIALLAEDAKVFFEGGDSFIGDMLKKYPQWADEIKVIAALFATLSDLTNMIFDGWSKIIDLADKLSFDNIKEVLSNIPGFLGDITGLYTVEGDGLLQGGSPATASPYIPDVTTNSSSKVTSVDKMEIVIQGGNDSADNIARAVYNEFQQASQELNSAVDQ